MTDLAFPVAGLVMAAVLYLLAVRPLERELAAERRRTSELLDRLQAGSLAEFKASEVVPQWAPDNLDHREGRWIHDPTGLQQVFVPKDDD